MINKYKVPVLAAIVSMFINVSKAQAGLMSPLKNTPAITITLIGIGIAFLGYMLEAIQMGSLGKFVKISGYLTVILNIANQVSETWSAISRIGG